MNKTQQLSSNSKFWGTNCKRSCLFSKLRSAPSPPSKLHRKLTPSISPSLSLIFNLYCLRGSSKQLLDTVETLSCFFKIYFLFFLTSLLEYNCFTVLCQFLLYNKVNQLYAYVYPRILSLLHLPPTLLIPPVQVVTKHRANLPVLSCLK